METEACIEKNLASVEKRLAELPTGSIPEDLAAAMRHAVLDGGKRVRPRLCLAAAVAAGGSAEDAVHAACAIELLHSYSLVHDDLPAMDNDTVRRGRPSVWAEHGETVAILAGDALQALAFKTALESRKNPEKTAAVLARAAAEVVYGQTEDLSTGPKDFDRVYMRKTAALFGAAAAMGAYAAGGQDAHAERLRGFAEAIGLAFQYEDDLLDGDSPWSEADTKRRIRDLTSSAIARLDGLPGDVAPLAALAEKLAARVRTDGRDVI